MFQAVRVTVEGREERQSLKEGQTPSQASQATQKVQGLCLAWEPRDEDTERLSS